MSTEPQRTAGLIKQIRRRGDDLLVVDRNLKAVMLPDGLWYSVEDPTLPQGDDGYLSFLQTNGNDVVMIEVPVSEIKAVSYYGIPTPLKRKK
jgi:hypothetical protein